jgi:hypothetical protein
MRVKIRRVTNTMIRESSLPHFAFSPLCSQRVRVASFDELDRTLQGYAGSWRQQQVDVFGHDDEGVQFESSLPAIVVESLEKESYVRFDNEEPAALPG